MRWAADALAHIPAETAATVLGMSPNAAAAPGDRNSNRTERDLECKPADLSTHTTHTYIDTKLRIQSRPKCRRVLIEKEAIKISH